VCIPNPHKQTVLASTSQKSIKSIHAQPPPLAEKTSLSRTISKRPTQPKSHNRQFTRKSVTQPSPITQIHPDFLILLLGPIPEPYMQKGISTKQNPTRNSYTSCIPCPVSRVPDPRSHKQSSHHPFVSHPVPFHHSINITLHTSNDTKHPLNSFTSHP
jgi:hypothetical protein